MPSKSFDRSLPAAPTNGTPCLSSWNPGASPTNISSAVAEPEPKTTCVRVCASAQRVQPATASPNATSARSRSAAATASATTTPAASTEAGLRGGAVRCEHRELAGDLPRAAVRTRGGGVVHADELLEVALAAHADVFVDRHGR